MNFVRDIRYAFASLRKSPGFLLLALATLGFGISANAAIFSLFYQILLRSLPIAAPDRLVAFHAEGFHMAGRNSNDNYESVFSYPLYRILRDSTHAFQGVAARSSQSAQMTVDGTAERVHAEVVSGNFFEVLGLQPRVGRLLNAADDRVGAGNPVTVLSYDFWVKRFGSSAAVLNRTLTLDGKIFTVAGVAPEGFYGVLSGDSVHLYIPLATLGAIDPAWTNYDKPNLSRFTLLGRLRPGVTRERAALELEPVFTAAVYDELAELKFPKDRARRVIAGKRISLVPAARGLNQLERQWRKPLVVLASMVGLLLLIGCANLANLLLARGVNRSRDVAVRLALGASRGRIFSMLLAESMVVAAGGAALGVILAPVLTSGVLRLLPANQTGGWIAGGLNLPVLAFCTLLMMAAGVVSGIAPAWQSSGMGESSLLGGRTQSAGGAHFSPRVRQGLVVAQLALSLVLLSTAGLFGKSLINLMRHDPGFRAENILTFSVDAGAGGYKADAGVALYHEIVKRLAAWPGVESVSIADDAPLSNSESSSNVTVEGYTETDGENMDSDKNSIGPGFFRTLGSPLIAGREFTESDVPSAPQVAIVNRAFVKRYIRNLAPLGLHMKIGGGAPLNIQIVGVARDMNSLTLREQTKPTFYIPYDQSKVDAKSFRATFFVRSRNSAEALVSEARTTVAQLDRTLPVFGVASMQTRIENSIYTDRLLAALTTAFGLLALILTAVGLYGVIAYVVGSRTAEMGIRMALGATGGNIMALILREVGLLTILGVATGVAGAVAAMGVVRSLLFGLDSFDPWVLGGTVLALAIVAFAAGAVPAARAAAIQPLTALRHE